MRDDIINRLRETDERSHIDLIHILKRGTGEILYYDERVGLALRHECGTVFTLPFKDGDLSPLYSAIEGEELICAHSERMFKDLRAKGYDFRAPCYTYSYWGEPFDEDDEYTFRNMTFEDIPIISEHYHVVTEKTIKDDMDKGNVIAIEKDGYLLGFSGFHSEEAMGMLTILPQYRRLGLGERLEKHIINLAFSRGWRPFCNVYIDNAASNALQAKLGLQRGDILSYWLWLS